jgi:hypothetical protein
MMIQNFKNETSIFFLLSNNHINNLIVFPFDFNDEEILDYYISLLKTLSLRLNVNTLQFFYDYRTNDFPLYAEAVKFFNHPDSMKRTAIRTLTLNVYKVDDPDLRSYILSSHAVPYFANLVEFIRLELEKVDDVLKLSPVSMMLLQDRIDGFFDSCHYLMDIFDLDIPKMSGILCDQLLANFVFPVLFGSLLENDEETADGYVSKRLAIFALSQIFIVFRYSPLVSAIVSSCMRRHPVKLAIYLILSSTRYPFASTEAHIADVVLDKKQDDDDSGISKKALASRYSEQDKPVMKEDLNLKVMRSKLPELSLISSVNDYPGYADKADYNPIRQCMFNLIHEGNESIVFEVLSLLMSMLRNRHVDIEQLIAARICRQRDRRSFFLLQNLVGDSTRLSLDVLENVESKSLHSEFFYNEDLVSSLLQILSIYSKPEYRYATFRLASELFMEHVFDTSGPCLKEIHMKQMSSLFRKVSSEVGLIFYLIQLL